MTNGPNGSSAATNTSAARAMGQRAATVVYASIAHSATNSTPCAQPTTVTANGMSAKYFSGIATKSSRRNDAPSTSATYRSDETGFDMGGGSLLHFRRCGTCEDAASARMRAGEDRKRVE